MTWHDLDSIRDEWPDAEFIEDDTLDELLEVAKLQVTTFAPALADTATVIDGYVVADPDPVPVNYRMAQRVQARNIWNAARVNPEGTTGEGDFVLRPFPLDWHVKQLLRPKRGIPVIG